MDRFGGGGSLVIDAMRTKCSAGAIAAAQRPSGRSPPVGNTARGSVAQDACIGQSAPNVGLSVQSPIGQGRAVHAIAAWAADAEARHAASTCDGPA